MLDVRFPTGNGLDLLRQLRAKNYATDVILVTAAKEVETLKEAMRGGVFYYIVKPLIFERLQEVLESYADHLSKIKNLDSLGQDDVDTLLPQRSQSGPAETKFSGRLPKGIDAITLKKVDTVFEQQGQLLSAEEVGSQIGASRTTARRYLEYMVSEGILSAEISYGTVGRPERRYQRH